MGDSPPLQGASWPRTRTPACFADEKAGSLMMMAAANALTYIRSVCACHKCNCPKRIATHQSEFLHSFFSMFATMNSRLFLPDSQASAVQFPPSCPVIFAEPAKRSSLDVDGSEAATASSNDKGMSVRLGKVTSVYIDISAGSNRELIYVVEVPNPKKDASPSANTTRTTIDVPESSLRYAPNCPALFDLENLPVAAQDTTSETSCGSTIMPALDTATAARGTILCGIPTTLTGNITAVSYSALIHLEDGGLREYHKIPLRCIRFDPTSTTNTTNTETNAIAPLTSNLSTNISSLDTTKPNIISKQSSIDDNANDDDEDGSDAEDTKCRTLWDANKCEELNIANSSVPNPSSNVRNLITTKSNTVSEKPKSLANKSSCPPPTSVPCTVSAVVCASPQTKTNANTKESSANGDDKKGNSAVVSPTVVRSSPHFRRLQLHLEKESSILKQLQPPDLSLSRNEIKPRGKGTKGKTHDRKSTKVTATKKSKPRKKGHGSRRSSCFGRSRGRNFARNDGLNSKGRC